MYIPLICVCQGKFYYAFLRFDFIKLEILQKSASFVYQYLSNALYREVEKCYVITQWYTIILDQVKLKTWILSARYIIL